MNIKNRKKEIEMINKKIFYILIWPLFCCVTANGGHRKETVSYVDIERFMGKWFVIASIPTYFEKGAHNAVETYKRNQDGSIHVDFIYNKNRATGRLKHMTQTAYITDKKTNAYWKIRPIWPFLFDYLVIELDKENYQYTIIGRPNKANVWIMARTPEISDKLYNKLYLKVQNQGYDIKKLKKVPQTWQKKLK